MVIRTALLICSLLLVVRPAIAETEKYGPVDLCAIPFSEAHRAALETEHIPALRRIFEDWRTHHLETKRPGSLTKIEANHGDEKLTSLENAIKTAKTHPGPKQVAPLPERPKPLFPPSTYDLEGEPKALILNDADQRASDAALQALLHWSCWTEDTRLILSIDISFNYFLGAGFRSPFILPSNVPIEDWRLRLAIAKNRFKRFPNPNFEQKRDLGGLASDLAYWSFNELWLAQEYRQKERHRLIEELVDWLLSSKENFSDISYFLWGKFQNYRFKETAQVTQNHVFNRIMEAYSERYATKQSQGGFSERNRFHIGFFMSELALIFKRHSLALCFLRDNKLLLESNEDEVGSLYSEINRKQELEYIDEYILRNQEELRKLGIEDRGISYPCINQGIGADKAAGSDC